MKPQAVTWLIVMILLPSEWGRGVVNACPQTTKKVASFGKCEKVPKGYFVYSLDSIGIFKSPTDSFAPVLIPNTRHDRISSIEISDDGRVLLFVDDVHRKLFLIRQDGSCKISLDADGVQNGAFYRQSPFGIEIVYRNSTKCLHAARVDLETCPPRIAAKRKIAQLDDSHVFSSKYYCVVGDKILGRINPVVGGKIMYRTGFMTIPDDGRGIATTKEIYRWKDDTLPQVMEGCGHTLSHDGEHAVWNPGNGYAPLLNGCIPPSHKGFSVTPFRSGEGGDIEYAMQYASATSINWCPVEFRYGTGSTVDFNHWYFGNDNRYLIGRLRGRDSHVVGIWLVEWDTNNWFLLTPPEQLIDIRDPAVFFGPYDPSIVNEGTAGPVIEPPVADSQDPRYRIACPNGGETFTIGSICTIQVSAVRNSNATLSIQIGHHEFSLPGLNRSIDPYAERMITFMMPDSFPHSRRNPITGTPELSYISPVSDRCLIILRDYDPGTGYEDHSDRFFSIGYSARIWNSNTPGAQMQGASCMRRYDLRGRILRPYSVLKPWCNAQSPFAAQILLDGKYFQSAVDRPHAYSKGRLRLKR